MRATRGTVGALAAIALLFLSLAVGAAQGATVYVEIKNTAFSPKSISISPGDTVVWTNNDTFAHDVTFEAGFGSGAVASLLAGTTFNHTFASNGTFKYRCQVHSANFDSGMTGSVTVGSAAAPPASSPGFEALGATFALLAAVGVASVRWGRR